MDKKMMKDLNSFQSERDQYKERFHLMIEEAKIEQLTNQKHKTNNLNMTSEDARRYRELREKAKNLIAKAREDQFDEKALKYKETNQIEEHSLSNIDTSVFLPSLSNQAPEKLFKSYRVKKVKDLPCLKKKLDLRLNDAWSIDDNEVDYLDNQLNNLNNKKSKSKSSPYKSYFVNYELQDLEKELEKIDKEAYNLEIALRHAIDHDGDKDIQEYYMKKKYESINKRNAAIRREMQLNLIEDEKKLNTQHEMVKKELQTLDAIEESQKTDAQKNKQKLLEEKLIEIVNKKSELLVRLDLEEQAIEHDVYEIINSPEQNIDSFSQDYDIKNCSLM